MNSIKKLYTCFALLGLCLPSAALAEQVLDKVEIVQTQTEADIHIDFNTQVRYLRHTPNAESSRLQVFLDFPQLNSIQEQREFLKSPPSSIVPTFVVNYPEQGTNSIGIRFKSPVKFRITPDGSGRGIVIHVPLQAVDVVMPPEVQVTPPVVESKVEIPATPEGMSVSEYVKNLVAESRVAAGLGNYAKAIQLLNTALNSPTLDYAQEAQELIGVAREKNGELIKAKAEYELYLKLYPDGDGAKRVRQHLTDIDAAIKVSGTGTEKAKKPIREVSETTVYGSWDQYVYDAHSHEYRPDPSTNSHRHDQSTLMSNINLTARSRQNEYDSKIVFRNRQTMDFLPGSSHVNRDRTDAAYVEVANTNVDYLVRLGRQSGNSGGVLGRFDGALLRYGLSPKYRINLVAGSLDEYRVNYKRHFYGVNLDVGPISENWGGNVFFINQTVGDILDRRAVGGELRYFNNGRSVYSLIDYDTLFNRLNTAMVQANLQTEGGTNYNMLIDRRKSPILTMTNSLPTYFGLPGSPTTLAQVKQLGVSEADIRNDALALTLDTELYLFGATRQITPRWQLGGDVQMTRSSGSKSAGQAAIDAAIKAANEAGTFLDPLSLQTLEASVGTGNIWTYHAQVVGTDTLFKDDTSIVSVSYTTGQTSRISSLLLSNVMVPSEKWHLESSLNLLRLDSLQQATPTVLTYIVSPRMRASYRMRDKVSLEAEIGLEVSNVNDPLNGHSRTFRDFSYIGYRIDI